MKQLIKILSHWWCKFGWHKYILINSEMIFLKDDEILYEKYQCSKCTKVKEKFI